MGYLSLDMLVPKAIKDSKAGSTQNLERSASAAAAVLPQMAMASPHSNGHEVKPVMALKLLRDIEQSVLIWQTQLRQVVKTIEGLHAQGPMVDGWLESSLDRVSLAEPASACTETTLLRHGDADALMQYVEALEHHELGQGLPAHETWSEGHGFESVRTQYRLCWLSDEGKVRSQVCPPEQMAVVSTAIARYQTCKQLLAQQQRLEAHLQAAVDGLTDVRSTAQPSN